MFAPEFRNRLDAIIKFANLGPESMDKVVDKFVAELEVQLADRKVFIELSDGARRWLAEKGYDRMFGARPLARVIQEHLKKPLAEEVLFGKLVERRRHGAGRRRGRGSGCRSSSSPSCRPSATPCHRPARSPCWLSEGIPSALDRASRRGARHRGVLGGALHHRQRRLAGAAWARTEPLVFFVVFFLGVLMARNA